MRIRKVRSPEEQKFMSLFGATDLYLNNTAGLDQASVGLFAQGSLTGAWGDAPILAFEPLSHEITAQPNPDNPESFPGEHHRSIGEIIMASQKESKTVAEVPEQDPVILDHPEPVTSYESDHGPEQVQADETKTDLEYLTGALSDSGHRVSDVKKLPSGAVRITVEDLIQGQEIGRLRPEPVFAGAGGRQP